MHKSFNCHLRYWAKKPYFAHIHTSDEQGNDKRMKKLAYS